MATNGTTSTADPKLALLLRECADYIEAGHFDNSLYTGMHDFQVYVNQHGDANTVSNYVDKFNSSLNLLGKNFAKQLGLSKAEQERRQATSQKNAERVRADLSDLNNGAIPATATAAQPSSRPAFQRPNNPSSTLIANGWIEQQRRSKMRVVWKDILASLVEGRKAGEETTLWIQREITNSLTGKKELEALHQIPIKWLEDVQLLDFYSDYRFSLKVYNVAEEFLFKCRDEESAQNWVLTLQSIREIVRKKKNTDNAAAAGSADQQQAEAPPPSSHRMAIKELKAIAQGAGVNTQGMDRTELERVVAEIAQNGGNASNGTSSEFDQRSTAAETARRREEEERQAEIRRQQEAQVSAEAEERRKQQFEDEQRQRVAARVAEQQRRAAEEEEKRRQAAIAEEARRRAAVAEEEARRRLAEQQAAEARRRQEEAARQQQAQWQQQQAQWQQYQQQQQAQQQHWQQHQQQAQQQQWQQHAHAQQQQWQQHQQYQQQQPRQQTPPPPQSQPRPSTQQQATQADLKYAKMATASSGEEKITEIKRNVLVHWALQPPQLQTLRQIIDLLCSIHAVFPPAFGVAAHDYFKKWKPIAQTDLVPIGAAPDKEKLKKAVRKLRFFLHPDKLPKDLNEEQTFLAKMLWDISSDAWEEYQKHQSDLDWVR